ncbi:16535_t:CDS:2, partial [Cetraspora pellucida]
QPQQPIINLNNSMHNLANQIAALVQQMQLTPLLQINFPEEGCKVVVKEVGSESENGSSNNDYEYEELEKQLFAYSEYEVRREVLID